MPPKAKKYGFGSNGVVTYNGPGNAEDWRGHLQRDLNARKTYNDMVLFVKANVAKNALKAYLHTTQLKSMEELLEMLVNEQNEYRRNNAALQLSQLNLEDSNEDDIDAEAALEQMYMISQKPNDKHYVTYLKEHVAEIIKGVGWGQYIDWVNTTIKIGTQFRNFNTGRTYVPAYNDDCQIDKQLQEWAKYQRQTAAGTQKPAHKEWQVAMLDMIEFVWDNNNYKWIANIARLKNFKDIFGHCAVPKNYEDKKLVNFTQNLRNGSHNSYFYKQSDERKQELTDLGFDPNVTYRDQTIHEEDEEMIVIFEKFFVNSSDDPLERHTNIPWLTRTKEIDLMRAHFWLPKAIKRISCFHLDNNNNDDSEDDDSEADVDGMPKDEAMENRLAEMQSIVAQEERLLPIKPSILNRLKKLNILLKKYYHYGVDRIENRHYTKLREFYKNNHGKDLWKELGWTRDESIGDDHKYPDGSDRPKRYARRPDMTLIGFVQALIDELDEYGHIDRSVESEQRKVYYMILLLISKMKLDINLVRLEPVHPTMPDERQVRAHAKIIKDIDRDLSIKTADINGLEPVKPRVRVILLDFEPHNHHIVEYQKRLIPPGSGIKRAEKEDEWDSKVMYDEVIMLTTDEVLKLESMDLSLFDEDGKLRGELRNVEDEAAEGSLAGGEAVV